MIYPAISEEYVYHHLHYPEDLHLTCMACKWPVELAFPDAGKLVLGLDEDIYQLPTSINALIPIANFIKFILIRLPVLIIVAAIMAQMYFVILQMNFSHRVV